MKKLFSFLILCLLVSGVAFADSEAALSLPSNFEIKQGMLLKWDDPEGGAKNLSTVTIANTNYYEPFGKWNALYDGWSIDFGWAYDNAGANTGAVLLGRDFGTLGKYLPISFPLKDKINITLYPLGVVIDDIDNNPSIKGASGVAILKFDVSF